LLKWASNHRNRFFPEGQGKFNETLCHKHIDAIKRALGIAAVYTEISSLRIPASDGTPGFQIDLLIDRKDDSINLCEIKFHSGPFTITPIYYQQLIEKRQPFSPPPPLPRLRQSRAARIREVLTAPYPAT